MEQLHHMLTSWLEDPERDHTEGIAILSNFTNNRMLLRSLGKSQTNYKREKLLYEMRKQLKLHPAPFNPPSTSITTNSDKKETDPVKAIQDTDTGTDDQVPTSEAIAPPVDQAGGSQTGELQVPEEESIPAGTLPIETGTDVLEIETPVQKGETVSFSPEDAIVAEHLEIAYAKMFNKKGMLINSLRVFKEEDFAGRKVVMDQIAGLKADMEQVKTKFDYYKLHGKLPEVNQIQVEQKPAKEKGIPDDPFQMQKLLHNERSTLSKLKTKIAKGNSDPERLQEMEKLVLSKTELVNEIIRRLGGTGGN